MFVMVIVLNLIGSQIVVGVVAANATNDDYGTTTVVSYYEIPYGNGIDDDHDGIVDNWGESDVQFGTTNITKSDRVINTWSSNFSYPSPREYGVEIGAPYDRLVDVYINTLDAGSSVSPIYSCYAVDYSNTESFRYVTKPNVINLLSFYMELTPEGLMNGASEIWYRSPLVWDTQHYKNYYLNIWEKNESGGSDTLVYATSQQYESHNGIWVDGFSTIPISFIRYDNSSQYRIYQKLNMNFRTSTTYYFREYVETKDNIPLNTFKCFILDYPYLGYPQENATYFFQDSPYSYKITQSCSWSMVPIIGIGVSGIEIPVWSGTRFNATYFPVLTTSKVYGGTLELNVTSAQFIIPLRCTKEINVTVWVKTWSGSTVSNWTGGLTFDCTGTIIVFLPVDDLDITQPNIYQVAIQFNNLDTTDYSDAVLFKVYPSAGSITEISYGTTYITSDVEVLHFATHIELLNETKNNVFATTSINWDGVLIGIGIALAGVGIIALTWYTGIGLQVGIEVILADLTSMAGAGTAILTVAGYVGGTLMVIGGIGLVINALQGGTAATSLVRGLLQFVEWVKAAALAVWNLIVQVIEAIKWFINAMLTWGGDILWAIAEVVYFVAFLFVMIMWNIFLSTMRYIATGDIEGAWASLKKPFLKSYRWVRKRPVYKIARTAATTAITKGAVKRRTAINYRRGVH